MKNCVNATLGMKNIQTTAVICFVISGVSSEFLSQDENPCFNCSKATIDLHFHANRYSGMIGTLCCVVYSTRPFKFDDAYSLRSGVECKNRRLLSYHRLNKLPMLKDGEHLRRNSEFTIDMAMNDFNSKL